VSGVAHSTIHTRATREARAIRSLFPWREYAVKTLTIPRALMSIRALTAALLLSAGAACGVELPSLPDQASQWAASIAQGAVATAEKRDGRWTFALAGQPFAPGHPQVPPQKVVFEIGSISKVFTGILPARKTNSSTKPSSATQFPSRRVRQDQRTDAASERTRYSRVAQRRSGPALRVSECHHTRRIPGRLRFRTVPAGVDDCRAGVRRIVAGDTDRTVRASRFRHGYGSFRLRRGQGLTDLRARRCGQGHGGCPASER
jgi:hypothetical protein